MSKPSIAASNRMRLAGVPHEFQRANTLGDALSGGWAKIPAYYYDVTQFQYPLTTAEFNDNFGDGTIKVFDLTGGAGAGRQTNAATGAGVNEPFIALGAGIVAIGQGESFTIPGAAITRPAAGTSTATPCFAGCVPLTGDAAARNATLWWGGATWEFIENFFQAYRLNIAINKRFLLVDEALFDVGMVPTPPEFVGASDSLIPAMPFIRATNDILAAKGVGKIFLPQNVAGSACIGSPTAGVTYGHPRIIGLSNRIYCFNQPIPFFPGMTFDTSFVPVENDVAFVPGMQRASTLSAELGATVPDAQLTETLAAGCSGFSSSFTIPGGTVSLGLVLKGYALQPSACVDYLANYLVPGSMMSNVLQGNQYLGTLLSGGVKGMNLAGLQGIPEHVLELTKGATK